MACVHCGDSGVLNVESHWSPDGRGWRDDDPYTTPCHCEAGVIWEEIGLGFC